MEMALGMGTGSGGAHRARDELERVTPHRRRRRCLLLCLSLPCDAAAEVREEETAPPGFGANFLTCLASEGFGLPGLYFMDGPQKD